LIGNDRARDLLTAELEDNAKYAVLGLGYAGDTSTISKIEDVLLIQNDFETLTNAAHALGTLLTWNVTDKIAISSQLASRLANLAQDSGNLGLEAAFALSRAKELPTAFPSYLVAKGAAYNANPATRALLTRTLSKIIIPEVEYTLTQIATNDSEFGPRVEAVRSLTKFTLTDRVKEAYRAAIVDPYDSVRVQTIEAIASYKEAGAEFVKDLAYVYTNVRSPWVKAAAMAALHAIDPIKAVPFVDESAFTPNQTLQARAIEIYGESLTDLAKLAQVVRVSKNHDRSTVAAAALLALGNLDKANVPDEAAESLKLALQSSNSSILESAAVSVVKLELESALPMLIDSLKNGKESRISVIEAFGAIATSNEASELLPYFNHHSKQVVQAAVENYKKLTGVDKSSEIPLNSHPVLATPTQDELASAANTTIRFETERGTFRIKTNDNPYSVTAYRFIEWAKAGFYDGKEFHRIVPNFVAQGGGFDTDENLLRDEVSIQRHSRGTVGIATAGKDTGGANFFVNIAPNLHLDGHYTSFAEVTDGMNIVDHLEVGDKILSATVE
ncbi:MAG: peptidylprolyl isomerase, partial [Bdellovibrionales bacterium]|nr:peptidylprolyl isomerase [Bdellovibrionales bacterium]